MMTGIGKNDRNETIIVLALIMPMNKMINLIAWLCAFASFLNIVFRLIIKLIPPDTIRASIVAKTTFHCSDDGNKYVKTANNTRSTNVQPIEAVANFRGVL